MMNSQSVLRSLSDSDLLARTREIVEDSCRTEADLLLHLGEIDERKLYLERSFASMFAFCMGELKFSEGATYNRILVARAARQIPAVIDAMRSGQVHLGGLRLLAPHLTAENHREVLAQAAGKSKREIEELVARLSPQPSVAPSVRKVPARAQAPAPPSLALSPAAASMSRREDHRPSVAPLSEGTYKVQFTAGRAFQEKLRQAQDLLRHRIPDGDLTSIFDRALDVLIEQVTKERFATGCKPRPGSPAPADESSSRHIPDGIKRAVYERDGGRCTFTDVDGRRCAETGWLEFDHLDGFARTRVHEADRIRLLCRPHNQHAAEKLYGRAFMERARAPTCPGTSAQGRLL
jgi:hypothetical protein